MTRQTETTRTDRTTAGTDRRKRTATETGRRTTMAELSHTNPYTGRSTGQLFSRGPIVRADGGETTDERDADPASADDEDVGRRMKDVSHTPPKDADDANRVFERGGNEMPAVRGDDTTNEPVGSDE